MINILKNEKNCRLEAKKLKKVKKVYRRTIKILQIWKIFLLKKIMGTKNFQNKEQKVEK